jgi:hypothetical protein
MFLASAAARCRAAASSSLLCRTPSSLSPQCNRTVPGERIIAANRQLFLGRGSQSDDAALQAPRNETHTQQSALPGLLAQRGRV